MRILQRDISKQGNSAAESYRNKVAGTWIVFNTADIGFHVYVDGTCFLPCAPHFHLQRATTSRSRYILASFSTHALEYVSSWPISIQTHAVIAVWPTSAGENCTPCHHHSLRPALLALFERSQHSKLAFHVPHIPWYSAYNNASAYHVLPLHTMKQLLVQGFLRYVQTPGKYFCHLYDTLNTLILQLTVYSTIHYMSLNGLQIYKHYKIPKVRLTSNMWKPHLKLSF